MIAVYLCSAAFIIANVVCLLDWQCRCDDAKREARAAASNAARFANRAKSIANLERFVVSFEARGMTIDASNARRRIARLAAWQSADELGGY